MTLARGSASIWWHLRRGTTASPGCLSSWPPALDHASSPATNVTEVPQVRGYLARASSWLSNNQGSAQLGHNAGSFAHNSTSSKHTEQHTTAAPSSPPSQTYGQRCHQPLPPFSSSPHAPSHHACSYSSQHACDYSSSTTGQQPFVTYVPETTTTSSTTTSTSSTSKPSLPRWLGPIRFNRPYSRNAELGDDVEGLEKQLGGFNRNGTPTFEVFEFFPGSDVVHSRRQRSAEELGLEPRDVSLFRSDTKMVPQRAAITPRDGVILVRTEVARAMIFADKAVLFVGRRYSERETKDLARNILRGIHAPGNLPFELVVLEALLNATVEYFQRQHGALKWMMHSVTGDSGLEDEKPFGAFDKAQMVIPIQKFMCQIKNDIRETHEALEAILDDSATLRDLCLTEARLSTLHGEKQQSPLVGVVHTRQTVPGGAVKVTPHMKLASNMLETYDRQILSIESSLLESEEGLETQRQLWHMQLDSSRNHIILFNMYLSMASISIMAATLIPAFFGMNLETGMGDSAPIFYGMVGLSAGVMLVSFPMVQKLYHTQYRKVVHHELADFKTLRLFLIRHMDDLDDIYGVLIRLGNERRKVSRQEFARLLTEALGRERALSTTSINLLYKMYCNQKTDELQVCD